MRGRTKEKIGQGEEEEESNHLKAKWRSHQTPCKGRRSARTTWEGGALGGVGGRKEPATSNTAGASSWWGLFIQCGGTPRMMAGCVPRGGQEPRSRRQQTSSFLRLVYHPAVACQLQHRVQDRRLKPTPTSSGSSKAEPVVFSQRDFPKRF